MEEFNPKLCAERHLLIMARDTVTDTRLKKVENRFLAIMTALVLNLLGVITTLFIVMAGHL